MKKRLGTVWICALLVCVAGLAACKFGSGGGGASTHTHSVGAWEYDDVHHWHTCTSCGAIVDMAEHDTTGEGCICGFGQAGIAFTELADGTYRLESAGNSQTETFEVPATHNGRAVTEIGRFAFRGCESEQITIPSSVKRIGEMAFQGCFCLKSLAIPDSVTEMDVNAISNCVALTEVTIGKGLTRVISDTGFLYFTECPLLERITVSPANTAFTSVDGIVYNKEKTKLLEAPIHLQGAVVIPDGVTELMSGFGGCTALREIVIPESITQLRRNMFAGCTALQSVTLSNVCGIGNNGRNFACLFEEMPLGQDAFVFDDDTEMPLYWNYNGVRYDFAEYDLCVTEEISDERALFAAVPVAFKHVTVENGEIPNAYFIDLPLESATLGSGVTSLEGFIFSGGVQIDIASEEMLFRLKHSFNWLDDKTLTIAGEPVTELTVPTGITEIRDFALAGLKSLQKLTVHSGVTRIGRNALFDCTGLTELTVPFIGTSIADRGGLCALFGEFYAEPSDVPESLKKVTVLGGEVYANAFAGCAHLVSVTLPDALTSIGDRAFQGCTALREIRGATALTDLGVDAIDGTAILETMQTQPGDVLYWGNIVLGVKPNVTACTIKEGVTSIMARTFADSALTSIALPESITTIGDEAFKNSVALKTVTFAPESQLQSIGEHAFTGCLQLESIEIPESVTVCGSNLFGGCEGLQTIKAPISCVSVLPPWLKKLTVTGGETVAANTFVNLRNLTELTVVDNGQTFEEGALKGLGNLQKLTIPRMTTKTSNQRLLELTLGKLFGREAATGATLTTQVVDYDSNADTRSEQSYYIPDSLTYVALTADDAGLAIGAFSGCAHLVDVVYMGSANIRYFAFYNCAALKTVYLSASVKRIQNWAFNTCDGLEKIYYDGTAQQWSQVEKRNQNPSYADSKVYYFSATAPTEAGNYWHYADGNVVAWPQA